MGIIKIDVERTGFPVVIGEVEIWFDSSMESLKNFANAEEIAKEKLKKMTEEAEHVHFPSEVTTENVGNIEAKTISQVFDLNKEFIAIQYDVIFGDGTFKKLYEIYPDMYALETLLDPIGNAIADKLQEEVEQREKIYRTTKEDAIEKKRQKSEKQV